MSDRHVVWSARFAKQWIAKTILFLGQGVNFGAKPHKYLCITILQLSLFSFSHNNSLTFRDGREDWADYCENEIDFPWQSKTLWLMFLKQHISSWESLRDIFASFFRHSIPFRRMNAKRSRKHLVPLSGPVMLSPFEQSKIRNPVGSPPWVLVSVWCNSRRARPSCGLGFIN